jgi:hypothetical protein
VEARVPVLLDHDHVPPAAREQRRDRRAGRTAADHEHVAARGGVGVSHGLGQLGASRTGGGSRKLYHSGLRAKRAAAAGGPRLQ